MREKAFLRPVGSVLLGSLIVGACGGGSSATSSETSLAAETAGSEASDAELTQPLVIKDVGFSTPESVLYDERADLYLVSNIQGSPLEVDDQAFISRVRPDGSVLSLKWIDSASEGVELDAPKGLAIVGDTLYVADITNVRKFDRNTGKPLGSIKIEGATFLNDIAPDKQGNVYVSDSGLTTGFSPSGTDAVYRIGKDDAVTALVKDTSLGRPNGLLASNDGVWVVSFGSGELYKLDTAGHRSDVQKLPKGSLDGIVDDAAGHPLVSSWEGSAVYRCDPGSAPVEIVSGVNAPADIGVDTRRNRVLIPLFNDNAVAIHQL